MIGSAASMAKKTVRDSAKTKEELLAASEHEFATKGLYGARIDNIATEAGVNKRMIYEYFGNKEELYKTVLNRAYHRLLEREVNVLSEKTSAKEAIYKTIHMYFEFLAQHETFVQLVLWENLNHAKYLKELNVQDIKEPTIELLHEIIKGGKQSGIFRQDLDADEVILSILTYTFSYFSNRYTMSILMNKNYSDTENMKSRATEVTEMVLSYMCEAKSDEERTLLNGII
jgi:Transcriptional regulator